MPHTTASRYLTASAFTLSTAMTLTADLNIIPDEISDLEHRKYRSPSAERITEEEGFLHDTISREALFSRYKDRINRRSVQSERSKETGHYIFYSLGNERA